MRLLLMIFLLHFSVASQQNGYYGKKNYVELNSVSYIPLFHNLTNGQSNFQFSYKVDGKKLVQKKDWLETGLRLCVGHAFTDNFGAALEFGIDFQNIASAYSTFEGFNDLKEEQLNFRTISIIPKIEVNNPNGLLPMGLIHQIGIGYTSSKVVDRVYRSEIGSGGIQSQNRTFQDKYAGFVVLYGLNMRTPLSKKLMLNYGFRYTFNPTLTVFSVNKDEESAIIRSLIRRKRVYNIISFNVGLTLPF